MTDPAMLAVATTIAGKAADAAADGARTAVTALVRLIRGRLAKNHQEAVVLDTALANPDDQTAVTRLAAVLEQMAGTDPGFDAQLRVLWSRAQAELAARDGGVVNSATGTVGGHLIQARDLSVRGDLNLGDLHGPPVP